MVKNKLRKYAILFLALFIPLGTISTKISGNASAAADTNPKTSEVFYDGFDGNSLDTGKWLVAKRNWGGYEKDSSGNIISNYNGGVVPENVSVENGILKLEAHGNNYTGDVEGVYRSGKERADNGRVGACIATKDYYASGSYEVNMKIPQVLGACSAIWTFNYQEFYDEETLAAAAERGVDVSEGYYVANHEIDIELPGRPNAAVADISYDYALCNTWRGETDVEMTTNYTNVKEAMGDGLEGGELGALADGKYHTYRFDWHTGDTNTAARVDYYIDNTLIKTCSTNVPNIAGRLWIGIWFPNQWAGTPDFDTATLEVDYVKITPLNEANDAWDKESYPDEGWGTYIPNPAITPSAISATAAKTDASAYGAGDGAITVTTSPAGIAVEYSIDGTTWQDSNKFTGLKAGTYTVKAREKGNTANISNSVVIEIGQPAKPLTTGEGSTTSTQQQVVTAEPGKIRANPAVEGKTATAAIDEAAVKKAFENSESLTVEVAKVDGVDAYAIKLPKTVFSPEKVGKKVEIVTDLGAIEVKINMLSENEIAGAGSIELIISRVEAVELNAALKEQTGGRPVLEISLKVDSAGKVWSNTGAPAKISIPYIPTASEISDTEHIAVLYTDGGGKTAVVPTGRYDTATGKVAFTTTHFGKYAIAYVKRTFSDIKNYEWAKNAIEVLASKGIAEGTSETGYTPSALVRRADFILMLVRALGLTTKADDNFADVKPDDYYAEALAIAKKLGIASGIGDNRFNPEAPISRQDMMTLINKALKAANKNLSAGTRVDLDRYTDGVNVSSYAAESVATLVKNGIAVGNGETVNPHGNATRAEAAVLIYKIYNISTSVIP